MLPCVFIDVALLIVLLYRIETSAGVSISRPKWPAFRPPAAVQPSLSLLLLALALAHPTACCAVLCCAVRTFLRSPSHCCSASNHTRSLHHDHRRTEASSRLRVSLPAAAMSEPLDGDPHSAVIQSHASVTADAAAAAASSCAEAASGEPVAPAQPSIASAVRLRRQLDVPPSTEYLRAMSGQ